MNVIRRYFIASHHGCFLSRIGPHVYIKTAGALLISKCITKNELANNATFTKQDILFLRFDSSEGIIFSNFFYMVVL